MPCRPRGFDARRSIHAGRAPNGLARGAAKPRRPFAARVDSLRQMFPSGAFRNRRGRDSGACQPELALWLLRRDPFENPGDWRCSSCVSATTTHASPSSFTTPPSFGNSLTMRNWVPVGNVKATACEDIRISS